MFSARPLIRPSATFSPAAAGEKDLDCSSIVTNNSATSLSIESLLPRAETRGRRWRRRKRGMCIDTLSAIAGGPRA